VSHGGCSKIGAFACARFTDGFVGQGIESASGNVGLELAIPFGGIVLGEPLPERLEILGRELLYGSLYFGNG
jgi:hypothetical protein